MARWQDYVLRDTRANQPTGSLVTTGTLYAVTDEGDIIERWSGTAWEAYSPTGSAVLPINLSGGPSQIIGDLPYSNLTPATGGSLLLGRRSTGAGDWEEISLGSNLTMTGTVLDSTGSSSGGVARDTNGFRLSLASGQAVFAPQIVTPSSTDTVNEIITVSADPGWYNGTIVTPATTVGGLTNGTRYFLHRITSVTYSFHTTVADAMSGASRVNLTASINVAVIPSGISTTGIYLTPFSSSQIALFDGYDWVLVDHAEFSVGLGTLSADTNYDLFVDYNSGTPALSIGTAWSGANTRAVALTTQDGVLVSSADAQSRYVGTFRTNSTTTVIDDGGFLVSNVGGKRFLWNAFNRARLWMGVRDNTSTWNYSTATWRQARSDVTAGNQVEFVIGLADDTCISDLDAGVSGSAAGCESGSSIGLDSTTAPHVIASIALRTGDTNAVKTQHAQLTFIPSIGYHTLVWLERGGTTTTSTWYGYDSTNNNRLSRLGAVIRG